jgi:hypothetical protein
MDWQQLISLTVVGATALMFVLGRRRSRKSSAGCGTLCSCLSDGHNLPPEKLIVRGRKGERPQLVIKMG